MDITGEAEMYFYIKSSCWNHSKRSRRRPATTFVIAVVTGKTYHQTWRIKNCGKTLSQLTEQACSGKQVGRHIYLPQ